MKINSYIVLITFIPWIIYSLVSGIYSLNKEEYRKISFKYLKHNFFKIFRIDMLILIISFFYFSSYKKEFVDKYLFMVMGLYFAVNKIFYENKGSLKQHFFRNNILEILCLLIVIAMPLVFYYSKHKLVSTYKLMFIYMFLEYIIILFISYFNKIIKKLVIRK